MQDIYIVGIGMTPFGKFRDKTIKDIRRVTHKQYSA